MYRLDPSPIKFHTEVTSPGFLTALLWNIIKDILIKYVFKI